jgi:hypothetical protein
VELYIHSPKCVHDMDKDDVALVLDPKAGRFGDIGTRRYVWAQHCFRFTSREGVNVAQFRRRGTTATNKPIDRP